MQEVFSVSNEVAAELATIGDGVLGALRDRLRCTIVLRGNRLTIEGDEPHVEQARAVVDELEPRGRERLQAPAYFLLDAHRLSSCM